MEEHINSLVNIYTFWFNPENNHIHFNSTIDDDVLITQKFKIYHDNYSKLTFDELTKYNLQDGLSYIILYDQLTRHIYRNNIEIINFHLDNIISYVKYFYDKYKDKLNTNEFTFTLLPLRHTNISTNVFFVIEETWKRIINGDNLNRYITATYDRYIKFNNDIDNLEFYNYQDNKKLFDKFISILDKSSSFNKILITKPLYKLFNPDYLDKSKHYIISLSGGVDSMVTSYVIKSLGFNITAVHISYMNRNTCELEIEMLKCWCDAIKINLYYRKINEIQRVPCMNYGLRDIYESYTREIRFKTYKNVVNILKNKPQVILGHNNDDAFENILTNICSVSHLDNLLGMQKELTISDINFIRPMLDIPKKNIYKFANEHNIPYLPTSTPEWSQRGKIRDKVRPALEEWNPNMINSLFKLSSNISSMTKIVDMFIKNTYDSIKIIKTYDINIDDLNLEEYFWNKLFKMFSFNISSKSLNNFLEKLIFLKKNNDKIKINKIIKLNLNKDIQIKFKKINIVNYIILF